MVASSSSSFTIDTSAPVLVTGATGYVAGVLIQQLLEAGVTVHAAVRDPTQTERLQYLVNLADNKTNKNGSIRFFAGDLLKEGSYADAMKGCRVVFHTASPFVMGAQDPQTDLIEPAVQGTRNVLRTCNATPSVQRVVLTSSCAAMYTDAVEVGPTAPAVLSEDVWNRTATLDYQPYSLSKTLAEQAAWVMAGSQRQWTLVTMNPSMILGPGVKYHPSSESFALLRRLPELASTGCPRMALPVVDVRDVARAHVVAAYRETVQGGRHVLCGHSTNLYDMGQLLHPQFGADYPLPARALPKLLVWLVAPYVGLTRRYVSGNVDVEIQFDNTKSQRALGMEYTPLETTLQDMFQQLIDNKAVTKMGGDATNDAAKKTD